MILDLFSERWRVVAERRKGYARSQGHRQSITMLRVVSMDFDLDELESSLP